MRAARAAIAELAAQRGRAAGRCVGDSGRLMLVAADHPARGALRAGDAPLAMADRWELLRAAVRSRCARPGVDGVLGTADILEDLLLLGALDGKVVIGSMNRGGLAGTSFEIDDRFTGYDADADRRGRLRGRQDAAAHRPRRPGDGADAGGLRRRRQRARRARLMAMVEPFISHRVDGRVRNDLTTEAVIRSVTVAAGLGAPRRTPGSSCRWSTTWSG